MNSEELVGACGIEIDTDGSFVVHFYDGSEVGDDFNYFEVDDIYTDYDNEFAEELGSFDNFDYLAKAELEDNSCPL